MFFFCWLENEAHPYIYVAAAQGSDGRAESSPFPHSKSSSSRRRVTDLLDQWHFHKNVAEIRISHRVLCAGCVPETNRSWNSIGELRDAGTNFLKTNFTCVRSVGPH
jgi:hypothetical protein